MSSDLKRLREKIDGMDEEIVRLLRDRMEVVRKIAEIKKKKELPILDLKREEELFQRIRSEAARLGLDVEDAEGVFREIVSMSYRIQGEERNVAFLGPRGTFAEEAARKVFTVSGTRFIACSSIFDTFRTVSSGGASYGVVPVENSTEGSVNTTLDLLVDSDLKVWAEIDLPSLTT